ncbi:MAG: DMT family protein [Dysgonomonas sp.]
MNFSALYTVLLLIASNTFMTLAWYGHLKLKEFSWFSSLPLFGIILISWGIAFFEYCFQVPANRIGYEGNGGPFSLMQLKIIQEVITLVVFVIFSTIAFKTEALRWNHLVAFVFLIAAVYFIFKK